MSTTKAETSAWDRFWFGETSLVRLGAYRIVILATALYAVFQFRPGVFQHAFDVEEAYVSRFWNPIFAFDLAGVEPMGATTARIVFALLLLALAAGIVGLFTRVACAVAAVLLFLWIGTAYSFGKPHHDCIALMFAVASLPLGPVGARLSLDSLRARWRRAARNEDPFTAPEKAPFALLPLRVTQLTLVLGYFFAGASKLAIAGTGWANGYTLQGIMLEFDAPWGEFFAADPTICRVLSVGMLFVQVTFPLILFSSPLRWFYIPMGVVFHLMTWKTMSTSPFLTLWFTLVAFVALERVPSFFYERLVTRGWAARVVWTLLGGACVWLVTSLYFAILPKWLPLLLLPIAVAVVIGMRRSLAVSIVYDGGCGPCRRTMSVLAALDWCGHLRPLDLLAWDSVRERHPELERADCERDMHVVDSGGTVRKGFEAYRAVAWRLPLFACFAPLLYLPPIPGIGARLYRRVADKRLEGACEPPVTP